MSSKLYFIQDIPSYIPTAWNGGWDAPGNQAGSYGDPGYYQSLDPDKYGIKNGTLFSDGIIPTTPYKRGIVQLVSRPLLPQTISGTINSLYAVRETNAGYDLITRWHIYVINCTTNAVHGILLNQFEEGVEWPTTSVYPGRTWTTPQALLPVTIPSDGVKYRIICEVGYKSSASAGMNVDGRFNIGARAVNNYGGPLLPDLTVGMNNTAGIGYLEFSGNLTFEPHPIPNIGPETAVEIPSVPYLVTIDPLKKSGEWGSDYENGGGYWYKYTAISDIVISVVCYNVDPLDASFVEYYTDPNPAISLRAGIESTYSNIIGAGKPKHVHYIPLKVGDIEYFRIFINSYTPGNTLTLRINPAPNDPVQGGDILISCDDDGFNIYDPTMLGRLQSLFFAPNGTIRNVNAKLPGSELGVTLNSGRWCLAGKRYAPWQRTLYIFEGAPSLAEVTRVVIDGSSTIGGIGDSSGRVIITVGTDGTDFYVTTAATRFGAPPFKLFKVTESGVVTDLGITLPTTDMGVIVGGSGAHTSASPDGNIFYYGNTVAGGAVKQYGILTKAALPDFATAPTPTHYPQDVTVLANGTVVVSWVDAGVSSIVIQYAPNGEVLRVIDFAATVHRIHHTSTTYNPVTGTSDKHVQVWTQVPASMTGDPSGLGAGYYNFVNLETGEVQVMFVSSEIASVEKGIGPLYFDPDEFIPNNCCPLIVVPPSDPTPISTKGKLTVTKVVNPDTDTTSFAFTTAGGLVPPTFNLIHGQEREFLNLNPSIYSVTETPVDNWTTEYSVSDGSPHTNISVLAGDDITVTVTNTKVAQTPVGTGIYFINPVKATRHDSYYNDQERKIPNPTIKTALLGE